jgi:phosphate starvation-inducible PhoH-like protein
MAKDPKKIGKGATPQSEGFNAASGAANTSGSEPPRVMTKAQIVIQLKRVMAAAVSGNEYKTIEGEVLVPTKNQAAMMRAIEAKDVVLVDGPFGTGKTIWTCYMGLKGLVDKQHTKIAITAPAVPAGEDIGFLPGEKDEKMLPHVNQILESIDDWIGKPLRTEMMRAGLLVIEPHAFLRGRSMKNTYFILDESQNASGPQLQTSLSRLGVGSTFIYMGDNKQNDRTNRDAAYMQFMERYLDFKYADYVGFAKLSVEDVRRHPFLKLVVESGDDRPLEGHETHKGARSGGNVTSITRGVANGSGVQPS